MVTVHYSLWAKCTQLWPLNALYASYYICKNWNFQILYSNHRCYLKNAWSRLGLFLLINVHFMLIKNTAMKYWISKTFRKIWSILHIVWCSQQQHGKSYYFTCWLARGGIHMLRHMCRPNVSLFHQKSLDMVPFWSKKTLRGGSHFTKIAKKNEKSTVFEAEKPLEMGQNLRKIRKNCLI